MLYFAYGSNLSRRQMFERCPGAIVVGRAFLPDHALVFAGFSQRWQGPVASVSRTRGAAVQGLLYRIDESGFKLLDRFEGCPHAYQRTVRTVFTARGRQRRALLYVQPAMCHVSLPPHRSYLRLIERAYSRLGFDVEQLTVAAGGLP